MMIQALLTFKVIKSYLLFISTFILIEESHRRHAHVLFTLAHLVAVARVIVQLFDCHKLVNMTLHLVQLR